VSRIHELYAYLRVADGARAIDYYREVFGAKEKYRLVEPGGRIGHAELQLGDAILMLSDEFPEMDIRGPGSLGATTVTLHLHVDDADAVLERAAQAGGEIIRPANDQFYGERSGTVRDPFGHEWNVGHSIEEVSPEEMQRRYDELMKR
jgi:uncharacterized glyoxalase superfamily protein PhnB